MYAIGELRLIRFFCNFLSPKIYPEILFILFLSYNPFEKMSGLVRFCNTIFQKYVKLMFATSISKL